MDYKQAARLKYFSGECPECRGLGIITTFYGGGAFESSRDCDRCCGVGEVGNCVLCQGTGVADDSSCPDCRGVGAIGDCVGCDGVGVIQSGECSLCEGFGFIQQGSEKADQKTSQG